MSKGGFYPEGMNGHAQDHLSQLRVTVGHWKLSGLVSAALGKDHDKDDDVNHGSAASSRVLSRRKFLNVSVTGAAIASAGGLSACMSRPMAAGRQPSAGALPGHSKSRRTLRRVHPFPRAERVRDRCRCNQRKWLVPFPRAAAGLINKLRSPALCVGREQRDVSFHFQCRRWPAIGKCLPMGSVRDLGPTGPNVRYRFFGRQKPPVGKRPDCGPDA